MVLTASKPGIWRHVLKLMAGAATAQAIVLLTTPLVTRFYTPHDFGVSALVVSFLAFLGPLSSLNYYQAIVLPQHDRDALDLARLSVRLSAAATLVFAAAFFMFRAELGGLFKSPELFSIFWLVPGAVFARSMYLIVSAWASRQRCFGLQAKARVVQTVSERVVSVTAGYFGRASSIMLVSARLLGLFVETGILTFSLRRRDDSARATSTVSLSNVARSYAEFPKYSSGAMLLANGSGQVPLLLLPMLFSPEVSGLYALADRLIQTPIQLLGESIRSVYYRDLAERVADGRDTRSAFIELRRHLVTAGFFPFAVLLVFGKVIFATLFGAEWERAGAFSGIIGFFLFFQFAALPISCVFNAYRRQKPLIVISMLLFVNSGASLFVGRWLASPEVGLALMSGGGVLIYLFMNYLAERVLGVPHSDQFVTYGVSLLANAPFVGAMLLFLKTRQTPAAIVAMTLVLACCYYGVLFRNRIQRWWWKREPT